MMNTPTSGRPLASFGCALILRSSRLAHSLLCLSCSASLMFGITLLASVAYADNPVSAGSPTGAGSSVAALNPARANEFRTAGSAKEASSGAKATDIAARPSPQSASGNTALSMAVPKRLSRSLAFSGFQVSIAPQSVVPTAPQLASSKPLSPLLRQSSAAAFATCSRDDTHLPVAAYLADQKSIPQTLLDEVGRLSHSVSLVEVASWKQEVKSARPAAERAAWLHLWLGEWELAQNEQPEQACWHFRMAQHLTSSRNRCYGLAAYDSAISLFYEGAYEASSDAFTALLQPKRGFTGYDHRNCALWLRHAQACAGYHEDHAKLGIPEPPRLDPLCGAASLAACLRSLSLPFDRALLLKVCRVTGEGSNIQDVMNAGRKLGLNTRSMTADDHALMALPKPLVAYVEQDHFVALVRADKAGISYLCSDCGSWPGGQVNLTWAQWHTMGAGIYVTVTKPGSISDTLIRTALGDPVEKVPPVRLSYSGSLSALHIGIHVASLSALSSLRGHIARYIAPMSLGCGSKPNSLHCPGYIQCPMSDGHCSGQGPQEGDPVNLATGEEEYTPPPDLVVYNPHGPSISWSRLYNSLRAPNTTNAQATVNPQYESTDYGIGWSHSYNYCIYNTSSGNSGTNYLNFVQPNGAIIPLSATPPSSSSVSCTVPAGTPYQVQWCNDRGNNLFVVTVADRSKWIFTPTSGTYATSLYQLTRIQDRNGNGITLQYQTFATIPLLSSIQSDSGYTNLFITRNPANNTIDHIKDGDGRLVYYHIGPYQNTVPQSYPANEQVYPELDDVSQVIQYAANNTPPNPFTTQFGAFIPSYSRWTYGYTKVFDGEPNQFFATLSSITVPSPASSNGNIVAATAYINYGANFVTSLTDANNNITSFTQVAANSTKVSVTNGSGTLVYSYTVGFNLDMSLTTQTDGTNSTNVLTKIYNPSAADPYRPVSITNGNYTTGSNNNLWQFVWDKYGNLHQMTSPRGTVTNYTWAFTPGSVPTTVNSISQTSAPILGELTSVKHGAKVATTYTYIDATFPGYTIVSPSTYAFYQQDQTNSGLIKTLTTAQPGLPGVVNSASYTYTYDPYGNVLTIHGPGNNNTGPITTTFAYDQDLGGPGIAAYSLPYILQNSIGKPLTMTDNLGNTTHFKYGYLGSGNVLGYLQETVDALGNETDYSYADNPGYGYGTTSLVGQLQTVMYPGTGQTGSGRANTTYQYLYVGGPPTSTKAYDESGNMVRQVNYAYDAEGHPSVVSGSTEPVSYTYDALYRPNSLTDGNGHSTSYFYNVAGYLDSMIYPGYSGLAPSYNPNTGTWSNIAGADSLRFTYDLAGNMVTRTDGNGVTTSYNHSSDSESLLTQIQYSDGVTPSVSFAYDAYDRMVTKTDGSGTTTFGPNGQAGYDDLDNPLNVQTTYANLPAQLVQYSYWPDGSRSTMNIPAIAVATSTPNGGQFYYTYDKAGRPTGVRNPYGEQTSWTYQRNDWLATQTDANGLKATYTFNPRGQVTEVSNTGASIPASSAGSSDFKVPTTQGYDGAGNLTSVMATMPSLGAPFNGTAAFTYDNKDQITVESNARLSQLNAFAYDAAGNLMDNRGVGGLSFNADNQPTSIAHDGNGSILSYQGAPLVYDAENRLTTVASESGSVCVGVAAGADNNTRVLWHNPDGSISLWTLAGIGNPNPASTFVSNWQYPPVADWTCRALAVGNGSIPRLLWVRTDGMCAVWTIGSSGSYTSTPGYTPGTDWAAVGLSVGTDGLARILLNNRNGAAAVWVINADNSFNSTPLLGPYTGWTAASMSIGPDGLVRLLWRNVDRDIAIWKLTNFASGTFIQNTYSANAVTNSNWIAVSISVGPDNKTRVLWSRTDGSLALWDVSDWGTNVSNGPFTQNVFGPYTGFDPLAISTGPDNLTRVVWSRTDGYIALWSENDGTGGFVQDDYGPQPAAGPAPALTCGYTGDGLRAWKNGYYGKDYFLYDGMQPVCEMNSSGTVIATNTFGAAGVVSRYATTYYPYNAGNSFYAYDERGNVAQRWNPGGTPSANSSDVLDAYGYSSGSVAGNDPWRFGAQKGYYTDLETGLSLLTYRYYDPAQGRFLTRDPAGYGGGINLYSYVTNNPVNGSDPFGLMDEYGGQTNAEAAWSGLKIGFKSYLIGLLGWVL